MSDYDTDLVLWSREQADLLRRMGAGERVNDQVDWENVAEEIESLGRSDWRELRRRVQVVLRHLIKLQASPALSPRNGWRRTVLEQRSQISVLLEESPSLVQRMPEAITKELRSACALARSDLAEFSEPTLVEIEELNFAADQVLGPWLPD
jgi:hypothetical protein